MAQQLVTVIGQFLHPPIGLCTLEQASADHTGYAVYTRPRGPITVDAFGMRVNVFDWPPGYGFVDKLTRLEFDRTMIEIGVLHGMLDGSSVFTDQFTTHWGGTTLMFSESFPLAVQVWVSPGAHATVDWVLVL